MLAVTESHYEWLPHSGSLNEYGIIIDLEEPCINHTFDDMASTDVFVKVLWQNDNMGAIWHWGEEIVVVKCKKGK